MKKYKSLIVSFVFVIALAMTGVRAQAAEPYNKIANAKEWEVLKKVNQERLAQGMEPLSIFAGIQEAAGVRAGEIADYFSHMRPDGSTCFTALEEQEIDYNSAGENIAAGYPDAGSVMTGWMNSSGHRANILGRGYTHIGIGYCTGGSYGKNWVQMFVGSCKVQTIMTNDKGTANYAVGTTVDEMNRYLILTCSHGKAYVPITSKMCNGYNPYKKGHQVITVSYRGKKVKMPVTVGKSSAYRKPGQIKNLTATADAKKAVTLKWAKKNGRGYEVWMATSANGAYKKVKTLTKASMTSYKVQNLKSSRKYYFKVRAYKKCGSRKIYGLFSKATVVKTK